MFNMLKQIAAALLIGVGLTGCMVEPKTDKDCKSVTKPKVDQSQVEKASIYCLSKFRWINQISTVICRKPEKWSNYDDSIYV